MENYNIYHLHVTNKNEKYKHGLFTNLKDVYDIGSQYDNSYFNAYIMNKPMTGTHDIRITHFNKGLNERNPEIIYESIIFFGDGKGAGILYCDDIHENIKLLRKWYDDYLKLKKDPQFLHNGRADAKHSYIHENIYESIIADETNADIRIFKRPTNILTEFSARKSDSLITTPFNKIPDLVSYSVN